MDNMVVAMGVQSKDGVPLMFECLYIWFVYVCLMLAHPICLCLVMIVYAVHESKRCCRWIWWDVESERGPSCGFST